MTTKLRHKKTLTTLSVISATAVMSLMSGCAGSSADQASTGGPTRLKLIDTPNGSESVSALLSIGNVYLDYQLPAITVGGAQVQASDVSVTGSNVYVSYSSYDSTGNSKVGAVQVVKPYPCDSLSTLFVDYCLAPSGTLNFLASDIFSSFSDGTDLYAVGSTSVEDQPTPGRLYKISLDSGKAPTAVSSSAVLGSFAGTGVVKTGTSVLVTYGTAPTGNVGGLGVFNSSTLVQSATQQLYDARSVVMDPSSSANAYVITGKGLSTTLSSVYKFASTGASAGTVTAAVGGNTIAESKSTVVVGNSLILASTGDGGFKVLCKATGAELASKAQPVITGIPSTKTVTNGLAAIPGYLFTANGEGGVGVYTFKKSSALNTNYCQGITLTYQGRLALDSDNSDATYVNAELSANSIKPLTILNVANVVTSRLLVVASGNKGISLLDLSALTVSLTDVDDF